MSAGIAGESRKLWARRGEMDWVVLVDEDTSEKQLKDSAKTIWILRESLSLVRKKNEFIGKFLFIFLFFDTFFIGKTGLNLCVLSCSMTRT